MVGPQWLLLVFHLLHLFRDSSFLFGLLKFKKIINCFLGIFLMMIKFNNLLFKWRKLHKMLEKTFRNLLSARVGKSKRLKPNRKKSVMTRKSQMNKIHTLKIWSFESLFNIIFHYKTMHLIISSFYSSFAYDWHLHELSVESLPK